VSTTSRQARDAVADEQADHKISEVMMQTSSFWNREHYLLSQKYYALSALSHQAQKSRRD
jgi:hypothetical protein